MKKAFVNCRIMPGGVLNVFVDLIESEISYQKNSQAKVFTVFSDRKYLQTETRKIEVITALPDFLNKLFLFFSSKNIFILSSVFDYRNLMFFYRVLMKILSKKIEKYQAPKVVVSSFAVSKNLAFCATGYKGVYKPITLLYLHSPMQYIRSHYQEYLQKLSGYKLKIFKYITPRLRKRDKQYTRFDQVYANSQYTANLAREIYNIKSSVKYPKVQEEFLHISVDLQPQNYYLYVGRLVRFVKELDKIITLFNQTGHSLLIMGSGPDEEYLKSISKGNIIFIGRIQDNTEKSKIIKNALGLINITKESFGLGTVEALLSGVPVFAYYEGASPELIDEKSGVLVLDKKQSTLLDRFKKFTNKQRDRQLIQDNIKSKIL